MSYRLALEMAGAYVHAYQEFGSYQGQWAALVTVGDGQTGWVLGSFGSCSGCDAFTAEMGWESHEHPGDHWNPDVSLRDTEGWDVAHCLQCQVYHDQWVEFGKRYLEDLKLQSEVEKELADNAAWDYQSGEALEFVKQAWAELHPEFSS